MRNIEFKILNDSSYSDEISKILNEEDMEALIKIKYIKIPNLFDSLKLDGIGEVAIVIGIDKRNNKLVGVGACTVLAKNLAYLNSFRIKKEYRNKINFTLAYKSILNEMKNRGINRIITTILEENKVAEKLLTKGKKNMPVYEFYKNINFHSIRNIKKGKLEIEDELTLLYKGLKIRIKKKTNKLYIAKDYKGIYGFLYKIRKILSYMGYPLLPTKNENFNFLYFAIEDKKLEYIESINAIKFLQNIGFNCDFFMIGVFEDSALERYLKKVRSFKYKSKLYKVYYNIEDFSKEKIEFDFWDL
ncbi:GNAT family N-acetyltransferase [Fusobacterium russii]|uniref:GNAT family N-acetyltransferase n=1 Tax=Fusobacterium russii TaxID=854 RepID=UPI00039A6EC3|nr:GNAT family N-acetyltransferase [Fusobacterium russii]